MIQRKRAQINQLLDTVLHTSRWRRLDEPRTRSNCGALAALVQASGMNTQHELLKWHSEHFGLLMKTELPEYAADGVWPQVWFPADGLVVVGVNSARANPKPTYSSGRIPDEQLDGLTQILDDVEAPRQ